MKTLWRVGLYQFNSYETAMQEHLITGYKIVSEMCEIPIDEKEEKRKLREKKLKRVFYTE